MAKESWLSQYFPNQAKLAAVIGGGEVTRRARLKAHRIWNGERKPNETEMVLIYQATEGKLTANEFFNLPIRAKSKKRSSN